MVSDSPLVTYDFNNYIFCWYIIYLSIIYDFFMFYNSTLVLDQYISLLNDQLLSTVFRYFRSCFEINNNNSNGENWRLNTLVFNERFIVA